MSATSHLKAPCNIFRTVDDLGAFERGREARSETGREVLPRSVGQLSASASRRRPANAVLRAREYLTEAEVKRLIKAARSGRHGHRDATLILIAYRHGLRASEVADLEWSQVELGRNATLHVRRAKNGKPSAHPLRGDEVRALRELRRQSPDSAFSLRHQARRSVHTGRR
jgi:integrase